MKLTSYQTDSTRQPATKARTIALRNAREAKTATHQTSSALFWSESYATTLLGRYRRLAKGGRA